MTRRRPHPPDRPAQEITLTGFAVGDRTAEGYAPVTLATSRGDIAMRWYTAEGARGGAILVGGAGGGFDTPVRGRLYPDLAQALSGEGVGALRVAYREPNDLLACTLDVLAGLEWLRRQGVERFALVGHSFGGAVVIQAAAAEEAVVACAPLSTQTYGAGPVSTLGPRCALFVAHGEADEVLPPSCSRYVYQTAREPKELHLHPTARHGLDEWADELPLLLRRWIVERVAAEQPGARRAG